MPAWERNKYITRLYRVELFSQTVYSIVICKCNYRIIRPLIPIRFSIAIMSKMSKSELFEMRFENLSPISPREMLVPLLSLNTLFENCRWQNMWVCDPASRES